MSRLIPTLSQFALVGSDAQKLAVAASQLQPPAGSFVPIFPHGLFSEYDPEIASAARYALKANFEVINVDEGKHYTTFSEPNGINTPASRTADVLYCHKDDIGVGLLEALRTRKIIEFGDYPRLENGVQPLQEHLLIIEESDPINHVIAAIYAFSIGAHLHVIRAVPEARALQLLMDLGNNTPPRLDRLNNFQKELLDTLGPIPKGNFREITFFTHSLPWGYAFANLPTSHLFLRPHLPLNILSAIMCERPEKPGIVSATLLNPLNFESEDIHIVKQYFLNKGTFIRFGDSNAAKVVSASKAIELFPYDFLYIATHSGDSNGEKITLKFSDPSGNEHIVMTEVAQAIDIEGDYILRTFERFISIDGYPWEDPKKPPYIDTLFPAYSNLRKSGRCTIIKSEPIARVCMSAMLNMSDGNLLLPQRIIANFRSPIVICNSCSSWPRLASHFFYCGARAYIGSIVEVLDSEASSLAKEIFGDDSEISLSTSVFEAQKKLTDDPRLRPYVFTGCHFQTLRSSSPIQNEILDGVKEVRDRNRTFSQQFPDNTDSKRREVNAKFLDKVIQQMLNS